MRFNLRREGENRHWPNYLFWGRMRTSTFVLLVAFLGTWWVYDTYRPPITAPSAPETQVVPPGFVPDPDYTWVPRTSVRERTTTTPQTTEPAAPTDDSNNDSTDSTDTTTTSPGDTTTAVPTPLLPWLTPQTTAANRSGTPTTTAPAGPGPAPTTPPRAQ
jgi:hypothetical protein